MPAPFPAAKFQSFKEISTPGKIRPRIKRLRALLHENDLDGFLVPHADAHRGESLPESERRLAHISGFTGSAGQAIITCNKAALFVDGRYTMQAPMQTDTRIFQVLETPEHDPGTWIRNHLEPGSRIGFDPWLHTISQVRTLKKQLENHSEPLPFKNLVEEIWDERPPAPVTGIRLLETERCGVAAGQKISDLQEQLAKNNSDALVLNISECICWLFNIRGRDVPNIPVTLAFALVHRNKKPELFINPAKLDMEQKERLSPICRLRQPEKLLDTLGSLGKKQATVWADPGNCPELFGQTIRENGGCLLERADPVMAAKAIKNQVEIKGMKRAHLLDGIAMARFLQWFDENAPGGETSEIEIASRLENFRAMEPDMVDISFDTIAGSGPNGAIIHYRVNERTNRILKASELMLLDSGAQYLCGTTDITRTLFSGSCTPEQRDHFTRVLKGMIAISTLSFPRGTTGSQIDILARHALWQAGLNYSHGTGHGVGAFLGVHEGPAGIAPRYQVPLEAGMVLSNEPGYYLEGKYGIRIENLLHVIESPDFKDFLTFETLTLVPIDTRLIEPVLMTEAERDWLNRYHAMVWQKVSPHLDGKPRDWLQQACRNIRAHPHLPADE